MTQFYSFLFRFILHLSLQYFTSSQTFSHFFRQVNGRLHTIQVFWGRNAFFLFCKRVVLTDNSFRVQHKAGAYLTRAVPDGSWVIELIHYTYLPGHLLKFPHFLSRLLSLAVIFDQVPLPQQKWFPSDKFSGSFGLIGLIFLQQPVLS